MYLTCLGAQQEVTGSCFLIKTGSHQILVDCGLIQGGEKDEKRNFSPFPFDPSKIDAVILTHAHIDHSGKLPKLVKAGFQGKIYTHAATVDLCRIMLLDAAYINEKDVEIENHKRQRHNLPDIEPLYTVADVENTLPHFSPLPYHKLTNITPGIKVRLHDAGHILGSAIAEVMISEKGVSRKLVFSGDLGRKDIPILQDPTLLTEADLVIMESTYGDRLTPRWEASVHQLGEILKEAERNKGNILIPSFAIGRCQELLYTFHQNFDAFALKNKIIFVDSPMAIEATKVYAKHWDLYDKETKDFIKKHGSPYQLPNLRLSQSTEDSMQINEIKEGAIIIAGSGMCDGGRIKHHLKHNIWQKNCHLIFVGYQAQGTLGRHIIEGAEYINLWGESIKVNAKIHSIDGFSAHADQQGLLDWYGQFKNLPPVILVHGEPNAMDVLKQKLYDNYTVHAFTPSLYATFDLIKRVLLPTEVPPAITLPAPLATSPKSASTSLKAIRLGIDTYSEPIIYLNEKNIVCHSEGFSALSRVNVNTTKNTIIATLNVVTNELLKTNEVGFSEVAWQLLSPKPEDLITISHTKAVDSFSFVRKKLFGIELSSKEMSQIVNDIVQGRYTHIQLSAFIAACTSNKLNLDELVALTNAMVDTGERLSWPQKMIMDKHCIGGLPGNRTTPIIVAIITACGLIMPKTSSRAITSPAGTADTMEVIAPVNLNLKQMQQVVEKEGGCIVWGGSVNLSPADDCLIQVERALDLDSEGQMVPSILSKKLSAGATHVLIDIPVGPTAKVRSQSEAESLSSKLIEVGKVLNLNIFTALTDGSQPVGFGIGPSLEMADILDVLTNQTHAPQDLKARAVSLAGLILEMANYCPKNQGKDIALQILESGEAFKKFHAICEAQGGIREMPKAKYKYDVLATREGFVTYLNNRFIAKLAKLAGAPHDKTAGVYLKAKLGNKVSPKDLLFTLHSESQGQLNYALEFLHGHFDQIRIEDELV